jgi:copper resistance protein C
MPGPVLVRVLGVLAALLAALVLAPVALAHDTLVSSTPAAGEEVPRPPEQVVLTFSATIGEQFAQVAVVDGAGTTYQVGQPAVDGPTLTQAVADLPAGEPLTISYRVVSSDGHPIGGTVPFTVAAAAGGTPSPSAEPTPQETPQETPLPVAQDPTTPAADTSPAVTGWLVGAGVLLLLAAAAWFARRRSRPSSSPQP